MRVGDRDRQRVGGIRLERTLDAEDDSDHVLDLGLVGSARADHMLAVFDYLRKSRRRHRNHVLAMPSA